MRKIGLSRLLRLIVLVPLLAMVAFAGVLVLETLNAYREVERLSELEQLVSAASQLSIKALNAESDASQSFAASASASGRTEMNVTRQRSDDAIRSFTQAARSVKLSDPTSIAIISAIEQHIGDLKGFAPRRTQVRCSVEIRARCCSRSLRVSRISFSASLTWSIKINSMSS